MQMGRALGRTSIRVRAWVRAWVRSEVRWGSAVRWRGGARPVEVA